MIAERRGIARPTSIEELLEPELHISMNWKKSRIRDATGHKNRIIYYLRIGRTIDRKDAMGHETERSHCLLPDTGAYASNTHGLATTSNILINNCLATVVLMACLTLMHLMPLSAIY